MHPVVLAGDVRTYYITSYGCAYPQVLRMSSFPLYVGRLAVSAPWRRTPTSGGRCSPEAGGSLSFRKDPRHFDSGTVKGAVET